MTFLRDNTIKVRVLNVFIHVGEVMGILITNLVLGFVYFFILSPIGIFFKLTKRKSVFQKIDKNSASYWECAKNSPPERFQRQF